MNVTWKIFETPEFLYGAVTAWIVFVLVLFMPAVLRSIRSFLRGEPRKTLRELRSEQARDEAAPPHSSSDGEPPRLTMESDGTAKCRCKVHARGRGRYYGWHPKTWVADDEINGKRT